MTRGDPLTRAAPEQLPRPELRAFRGAVAPPAGAGCPPAGASSVPAGAGCPPAGVGCPSGDDRLPTQVMAGGHSCRGTVTAEFAVALPAVVFLLALLLAGSAAGVTQLRLEEAARAGARALARGESPAGVEDVVRRLAGQTAGSAVAADGEWTGVTVSGRVPGALGSLLPWTFSARAWARREPPRATGFVRVVVMLPHQPTGSLRARRCIPTGLRG